MKSGDLLKITSKNSYSNKYLEEQNRTKVFKLNSPSTNLKSKFDIKDVTHPAKSNKKIALKKGKNNSMGKIPKIGLNKNICESESSKKKTRNLSNFSYNENFKNNVIDEKFSKTTSQISLYKNLNNQSKGAKSKDKKNLSKENIIDINNGEEILVIPDAKDLSKREQAYLILAYSKCLRLTERAIFAFSSPKLKEVISKKHLLETNKKYLKEKLGELEKKINICNNKLMKKFCASKTAEITLNFKTFTIEADFKLNFWQNIEDEVDKKYCCNYIKLLYLVLGENYYEIANGELIKNLYNKIGEKNYLNIKDYLFHLYIQNTNENKSLANIDKINNIIKITPDILNFKVSSKFDKFILYTSVLLNEIIKFANERADTMKLLKDCKNFIDIINVKLNLYKENKKTK